MSDEIGPVFLGGDSEVFIAKDWGHQRSYSEEQLAGLIPDPTLAYREPGKE